MHGHHIIFSDDEEEISINTNKRKYFDDGEDFNPKRFKKGNEYKGIRDSSDSESSKDEVVEEETPPNDFVDASLSELTQAISRNLEDKLTGVSSEDIQTAVKSAVDDLDEMMVDEYFNGPRDISWKTNMDPEEVQELTPQLKQLRRNIKSKTPTIPKILKSKLSTAQKERALQLYDTLDTLPLGSFNYIHMCKQIEEILETAPTEVNPQINNELLRLHTKIVDKIPTIEKIVSAKLTESDKMKALQLYEILQQCEYCSKDWFVVQDKINYILRSELETEQAVAELEAEESNLKKLSFDFNTDLKRKIFMLDAEPDIKNRLYEMYCDMISRSSDDSKYTDLRDKILLAVKLPYRRKTIPKLLNKDLESIRNYCLDIYNQLDGEIYGMKEAKIRIIQNINDRIYNPNSRNILALKGKSGVGKTKLAKIIAKVSGRPFEKISLGGTIDSTIFKGSDNVWSGSSSSLLLQILSRVKYSDAVILLDELDKLGSTEKGIEVQNALLHVLDPSQNTNFQDAYLCELPHDISNIWFIPAMNDDTSISGPLRDRLDIIELPTYTREEMVQIIKLHTLPEAILDKGLNKDDIKITDTGAMRLLQRLGDQINESGMRPVEKAINNIVSKLNLLRSMGNSNTIPLPFKLKDFQGFPYTITESIMEILQPSIAKDTLSYII